ncbi:MAG: hypothetical protein E2O39_04530 [Planctomycetota bacterium]|nr:MAG: hypothetical protein E2O39_04530 [Planctomycetota bacterium]
MRHGDDMHAFAMRVPFIFARILTRTGGDLGTPERQVVEKNFGRRPARRPISGGSREVITRESFVSIPGNGPSTGSPARIIDDDAPEALLLRTLPALQVRRRHRRPAEVACGAVTPEVRVGTQLQRFGCSGLNNSG